MFVFIDVKMYNLFVYEKKIYRKMSISTAIPISSKGAENWFEGDEIVEILSSVDVLPSSNRIQSRMS